LYAAQLGVSYGKISIRHQKTRWGCCSSEGNLTFNCLLLLTPPEILDYIVVHELCHRKEMNHSRRFYALLDFVLPNHRAHQAWLKEHGHTLLAKLPK
jgi:predicted metal-dependent hydrolase